MNSKLEVRKYQKEAVDKCVAELKVSDRAQCRMAPGSGKTIVSLIIKEKMKPKITIFFVPTIQLIYQQYLSWAEFNSRPFDALVITSGRITAEDKVRLDLLAQTHIGTTTSEWSIIQFLQGSNDRVIFSTYKSAPTVITACADYTIDFAVFDEAHHIAGGFEKRAVQLLYDNNINIKKRLFMTATPRLNRNEEQTLIYAGMDVEELFGKVAYYLSFKAAVHKNILCDYELVVAAVTPGDLNDIDVNGTEEEKIALAAIRKIMNERKVRRGLTFHSKISRAVNFSKHLTSVLDDDVVISTVNSSHTAEQRSLAIDNLKNSKKGIITNVRVLGEGFDFSALDFIVLVDPKRSTVDIVQNIGRVMRKHKGKKTGTVIIPVLVDDNTSDAEAAVATMNSRFMPVYHIATVLGTLDSTFGAEITAARATGVVDGNEDILTLFHQHMRITGVEEIPKDVINELSTKVRMYALYGTNSSAMQNAIQRTQELYNFCEKHNRLPVCHIEEEISLYMFFHSIYTKATSPRVKLMLEPIRQRWGKNSKALSRWSEGLIDIISFCEKHGHQPVKHTRTPFNRLVWRIHKNDYPTGVEEALCDLIEKVKSYPYALSVRFANAEAKIGVIERWTIENNRLPTLTDVKNGRFCSSLYAVLSARDRLARQEQSDRLNALVDLYAGAGGPQTKMKTAQRMPYEKKRLLLYNRNKQKLNELAKWIRKHNSLPTPKTNPKLSAFSAARYSSKVSEIMKELINEVIENNLKANIDEVDKTMREEETV